MLNNRVLRAAGIRDKDQASQLKPKSVAEY